MRHRLRYLSGYVLKLLVAVAAMGGTAAVLADQKDAPARRALGKSIRFVQSETYTTECASCHLGFLPGFLPARSWKKLMAGLDDHFGENASLDKPVADEILDFLNANAAGAAKSSPRSKRIERLMSKDDDTIRITETPFWIRKHASVKGWVWKREKVGSKAKCDACHGDAAKGLYSEYTANVPD